MELTMTILGMVMAGISITFTVLELFPFLNACKKESQWIKDTMAKHPWIYAKAKNEVWVIPKGLTVNLLAYIYLGVFYMINMIPHLKLIIPPAIDFFALAFLGLFIATGSGYASGVTSYFLSNVISTIIYYHTHWKHGVSWKGEAATC